MMLKSDIRTNYALYKNSQPLFKKWIKEKHTKITTDKYSEFILDNLPEGRSLWIDSFGYCFKSMLKKHQNIPPNVSTYVSISVG